MAKCPQCKKEIVLLVEEHEVVEYRSMGLSANGELQHVEPDFDYSEPTGRDRAWMCPECAEILATSEREAIKILTGRKGERA
jgi:phage FluMu protein Com